MSQSKLFLHDHPASSYAQKVRMALREKGIPFEKAVPDGLGSGQKLPDLSDANPRVEVPALIDGDFKIFDSKVILQYLEEKYPEHPLLPTSVSLHT
jgi:RNA polymerase-associated protein